MCAKDLRTGATKCIFHLSRMNESLENNIRLNFAKVSNETSLRIRWCWHSLDAVCGLGARQHGSCIRAND